MANSKEYSNKYRDIIENVSDLIYELNGEGYYTYVNSATIATTNYNLDELQQKRYTELIHEDDLEEALEFFTNQKNKQIELTQKEFRIVTKNNEVIWVEQTTKMFFEGSKLIRVLAVAQNITRLKSLQSDLRQQSELYRIVSEHSQDLIAIHAPSGVYKFLSPSVEDLLGYKQKELIGVNPYDIIHPEDVERLKSGPHQKTLEGQAETRVEYRIRKKNGQYIWMEAYTKPIMDQNGLLTSFQTSSRDITDKKNIEDAVKKSEAGLRALIENTTDTICALDNEYRFLTFNSALKNFLTVGTGQEPRIGEKLDFSKLGPSVSKKWKRLFKRARNGERFTEEMVFKISNVTLYFENHLNPILDDNNNIIGVSAFGRNITAKKEEEKKLQRFQEGLKLINKLAAEVTLSLDDLLKNALKVVCEFLNLPLGIISKIDEQDYVVKHFFSSSKRFELQKEQQFQLGSTYCDLTYKNKKVTSISNMGESEYRGHPCYSDFGLESYIGAYVKVYNKKYGTVNFSSPDIRKIPFDNYDEDFVVLLANWIGSVIERHQNELSLKKAKIQAELASEAKANFLSTMSHEIRTPLNGIIGLTHLLLQENPKKEQMQNLNLLKFSGENLLVIINDILDYNKIESGKIELENTDFNLYALLSSIKQTSQFKTDEKGISFKFDYDKKLPEVFIGDSVRIGQIINNLVSNAIKFTEKGFVSLKADFVKMIDRKIEVKIEIQDSGIGIKKKNLEKIFERFTQEEASTTRKYGGSGLGLSITTRLLELMGSTVRVTSVPGEGSTFFFNLKLPIGNENLNLLARGHSLDFTSLKSNNLHFLVVEDNQVNLTIAEQFLKQWGISVDHAEDGLIALEMVKTKKYDMILMDLQMPNMDGYTATKQIRVMEDHYYKSLPILALTASVLSDVGKEARQVGMNDFITKPFTPFDLYDKITKNLNVIINKDIISTPELVAKKVTDLGVAIESLTAGDEEFKKELVKLYIENFRELSEEFTKSILENDPEYAEAVAHKMKTTLNSLNQNEIIENIEIGKKIIGNDNGEIAKFITKFKSLCDESIKQLNELIQ